jgi:hypothetical protein
MMIAGWAIEPVADFRLQIADCGLKNLLNDECGLRLADRRIEKPFFQSAIRKPHSASPLSQSC